MHQPPITCKVRNSCHLKILRNHVYKKIECSVWWLVHNIFQKSSQESQITFHFSTFSVMFAVASSRSNFFSSVTASSSKPQTSVNTIQGNVIINTVAASRQHGLRTSVPYLTHYFSLVFSVY